MHRVSRWLVACCCAFALMPIALIGASADSQVAYHPIINPKEFVRRISNPYFPLRPGTTYTYEGTDEGQSVRDVVEVTHQTKEILGVTCVVVIDTVSVDGELTERTEDWYAQDRHDNVWYFGEDSKEYENGVVVSTEGSWQAGVNGAQPGIIMEGHPHEGDTYRQEYYAGVAEDMAQVLSRHESITVPYGSFKHVLETKEWTPLEPGVVEHKYYAKDVGVIKEIMVKGGNEVIELVSVETGN